ncbi:MAG: hypothetical protein JST01_04940 [Cyanobacteria bacterium SZAS TMP-1]|nr:hypothetical protein [Cyanobacteria bacterium SZAS TMP-1]
MRYVLEAIANVKNYSGRNLLVERVFLNAGSRQYSCVECDIVAEGQNKPTNMWRVKTS